MSIYKIYISHVEKFKLFISQKYIFFQTFVKIPLSFSESDLDMKMFSNIYVLTEREKHEKQRLLTLVCSVQYSVQCTVQCAVQCAVYSVHVYNIMLSLSEGGGSTRC